MSDPCTGPRGEDLCHLAQGPPRVDFDKLPQKRRERVAADRKEKTKPKDPRIKKALRAVTAVERSQLPTTADDVPITTDDVPITTDDVRTPTDDDEESNYRQTNPNLRANTKSLSIEEMDKARMVRAGKTFYKQGALAAQSQLDSTLSERGWRIDTELSSNEGLVLEKNGRIKVAYRGTDFTNMQDLVTDAAAAAGVEKVAPQMRESRMQIEDIQTKYGKLPTELVGYSKGGAHAMAMGDRFKIPSTSFNPLVGRGQLMGNSDTPHTIFRTVEDPVSATLALAKGKKNFTVKGIDPIFGFGDPKNAHELTHFTNAGPRQPGGIELLMHDGVRKGQILGHLKVLDAMKTGVERGQSFTEAVLEFNQGHNAGDVLLTENGTSKLGPRIHNEAAFVKDWKTSGGMFTISEQTHIDSITPPPKRVHSEDARAMGIGEELTEAQRSYVTSLTSEERANFMRTQEAAMVEHTQTIDATTKPHETVIRGMMPKTTSLATGAVSALAAHAVMNVVDPDHKMNRVAEEATEGALAGAMGVGAASALGASAALGPEVLAASAGYVAGAESATAITSALERGGMDEDAAEGIGAVSGGAIGGVTTSAVSVGATVLTAMAFGTEIGEVVGILGGPAGIALGAAAGATIGAAIGGVGYLFSHTGQHDPPPQPPAADRAFAQVQQMQQQRALPDTVAPPQGPGQTALAMRQLINRPGF